MTCTCTDFHRCQDCRDREPPVLAVYRDGVIEINGPSEDVDDASCKILKAMAFGVHEATEGQTQ